MKIELLSPAGSIEAVYAAVQSGADAVYLGSTIFNARRNAKNMSVSELAEAIRYCRLRGVRVHVTLNILLNDRELPKAAEYIKTLCDIGTDALIIQDLGVAKLVREIAPDMPMHASTQMSIHNIDGVLAAASLGFERVVLARELSESAIRAICKASPIEIEVFAHGALCMCYSGQCYMSGLIGQRSGNRGLCAQPCRMKYSYQNMPESPILSLRDLNLAKKLESLKSAGVASIKLEGRMKRPEYVALVTSVYRAALDSGMPPSERELADLELMFSRGGFTDGYYTNKIGKEMFGSRSELPDADAKKLYDDVRARYEKGDCRKIPITMELRAVKGRRLSLVCYDEDQNRSDIVMAEPSVAQKHATEREDIEKNLKRVGNTVFEAKNINISLDDGLMVPLSAVNNMRRKCLDELTQKREALPIRNTRSYIFENSSNRQAPTSMQLTCSVMNMEQISDELLKSKPQILYIPLVDGAANTEKVRKIIDSGQNTAAIIPRVITPGEEDEVITMLARLHLAGIREVLCGNLGHILLARHCGFISRGDYGLNVYNSETIRELSRFDLKSATVSFEMRFSQIKDIQKCMELEAIVYGRLPLMVFENCVMKTVSGSCVCDRTQYISDRMGRRFPLAREYPHRNQLLNSEKLWLADKDFSDAGLWAGRLMFTTENARECAEIMRAYRRESEYMPQEFTRGLYYRGVE